VISSTQARAALAFLLCWCAVVASMLLASAPVAALFGLLGLVAWVIGMRASVRAGRRRVAESPRLKSGRARGRVARALVMSWLLPGLGDLYAGLPRRRAMATMLVFFAVAVPTWTSVIPPWLGVLFAAPVWLAAQAHLRRETGWGWAPLFPSWGELLPGAAPGS
jgi:hypothetical protein